MDDVPASLSSPFSMGGGGFTFETHVQAAYVVLLLTEGFAPCLRSWSIQKIKLQGRYAGYRTDDFIVFATHPTDGREAKLLAQIKHSVAITENDNTFEQVIAAAWKDFNDSDIFTPGTDSIALITGPLSAVDTQDTRCLLDWAKSASDAKEFFTKVNLARFSSEGKRSKLKAFRAQINKANGAPVSDDQLFLFLKSFNLLGYDFDSENGLMASVFCSIIGRRTLTSFQGIWERIVTHVQYVNQNAGTIERSTIPSDIIEAFSEAPPVQKIPAELATAKTVMSEFSPAAQQSPSDLTLALLAGEWQDSSEADTRALEVLTGIPYAQWIIKIRELFQQPESPLSLRNGHWEVLRREELWRMLGGRVFDEHLDRFRNVAVTVLRERNPELKLDPEKRHEAQIYGKVLEHSRYLREGISITLAILATRPELFTSCSTGKANAIAAISVREVLREADWELWASLDDVLPLLAEAAPNDFCRALEDVLQESPTTISALFGQERAGLLGRTYIAGLLWALESLAWDPMLLVRVAAILGKLASIDPGGNWSNRPANSLSAILLPWLPQTVAPVATRKTAIDVLERDFPEVAWKVLLTLLPSGKRSSSGTRKPKWRKTSPEDHKDGVSLEAYWEQVQLYSRMAVDLAKQDSAKLVDLAEYVDDLDSDTRKTLLDYLSSEEGKRIDENVRAKVWEKITSLISHHRRSPDADWALPAEVIDDIEKAAKAIAPQSPNLFYRRLFSDRDFELLDHVGDYGEQHARLDNERQQVIKDIFGRNGIEEVFAFARVVQAPQLVGKALGSFEDTTADDAILPRLLSSPEPKLAAFAADYVHSKFSRRGWSWVESLQLESWTLPERGQFLAYLPFVPDTWSHVNQILGEAQAAYWQKASASPFESNADLTPVIRHLIEVDRPNAAVRCLRGMLHKGHKLDAQATIAALAAVSDTSSDSERIDPHAICLILKNLQERDDVPVQELANLEWKYLTLLTHSHEFRPLTLERALAADPLFFTALIRAVYRSKNDTTPSEEPTEEEKARASTIFDLLFHWKFPPGLQEDGSFDGEHFNRWLTAVKAECSASGHLDVAFAYIGKVLRYSPPDTDGLWLPRPVALALNAPDAKLMRVEFRTELFNSRGVHGFTSGQDEITLAEKYEADAKAIEEYHLLAAELRLLAEDYRGLARRGSDDFY